MFVWGLPEGYKYLHLFIVMVSLCLVTIQWPEKSVAANVMAGEQGPLQVKVRAFVDEKV